MEEAGLKSDTWELYKTYEPTHKIDWQIFTYIARNCEKIADQSLDAGEKIEVIEVTFDEFIDIVLSDKYWGNELIMDVLRMKLENKLHDFKNRLFIK